MELTAINLVEVHGNGPDKLDTELDPGLIFILPTNPEDIRYRDNPIL